MAKTIASLAVSVTARTGKLRRGMQRASGMVSRFDRTVAKMAKRVAMFGVKAGVAGAAIATLGTGARIRSLSNLAKTVDKLSGIDPTALIALRDAAQESGVEVRTFDMALQRMLRRIQEAAQGKGEAQQVLKDLKLDAKDLVKLKPEEQFEAIAKAMGKAGDEGFDLSRAFKLFDSEGVAVVNTLRLINEKGLEGFIKGVEKTGRAVTREQLKPMERVEDRLLRIGKRMSGIFTRLALALSPLLDKVLKRLERFLDDPKRVQAINEAFREFAKNVREVTRDLDKWIKRAEKAWKALKQLAESAKARSTGMISGAVQRTQEIGRSLAQNRGLQATARLSGGPAAGILAQGVVTRKLSDAIERKLLELFNRITGRRPQGFGTITRGGEGAPSTTFGSGTAVQELKRQTELLRNIDRGTDPRSLPAGTMVIRVAG